MHHRHAWIIWLFAATFYCYEFIERVAPAVMIPELMQHFGTSGAIVGSISAYYYYSCALLQIPAGIAVDQFSIRRVLTFACALCTAGSFIFALSPSVAWACLGRALVGAGSAFAFVGTLKLANAWFSAQRFPLIVGLTNWWGVFGAMLAGAPLAYFVVHHGWQNAMLGLSFLGVAVTILLYYGIEDPPLHPHPSHHIQRGLLRIVCCPHTWMAALYGMAIVAPIGALPELWAIPFFMNAHHLSLEEASFANSMIFVGIAIGGPVFGLIYGRLKQIRWLFILGSVATLLTLAGVLWFHDLAVWSLAALLTAYGFFSAHMLLCFSYVVEMHPRNYRGFAIGLLNTLVMLGSAMMQPWIGRRLDVLFSATGTYTPDVYVQAFSPLLLCIMLAVMLSFFFKGTAHGKCV